MAIFIVCAAVLLILCEPVRILALAALAFIVPLALFAGLVWLSVGLVGGLATGAICSIIIASLVSEYQTHKDV
jgi:hypothetical protein